MSYAKPGTVFTGFYEGRVKHMNESVWLQCNPEVMFQWMSNISLASNINWDIIKTRYSDRTLRLFATACCRQVWNKLSDTSRTQIEIAEACADGGLPETILMNAETVLVTQTFPPAIGLSATEFKVNVSRLQQRASWSEVSPGHQACIVREIFGNPFRITPIKEKMKKNYITKTVQEIARRIYDNRDFDSMPILWDALADGGCENENIERHCKGYELCGDCEASGIDWDNAINTNMPNPVCHTCNGTRWRGLQVPHTRGCWVLDGILEL